MPLTRPAGHGKEQHDATARSHQDYVHSHRFRITLRGTEHFVVIEAATGEAAGAVWTFKTSGGQLVARVPIELVQAIEGVRAAERAAGSDKPEPIR